MEDFYRASGFSGVVDHLGLFYYLCFCDGSWASGIISLVMHLIREFLSQYAERESHFSFAVQTLLI